MIRQICTINSANREDRSSQLSAIYSLLDFHHFVIDKNKKCPRGSTEKCLCFSHDIHQWAQAKKRSNIYLVFFPAAVTAKECVPCALPRE